MGQPGPSPVTLAGPGPCPPPRPRSVFLVRKQPGLCDVQSPLFPHTPPWGTQRGSRPRDPPHGTVDSSLWMNQRLRWGRKDGLRGNVMGRLSGWEPEGLRRGDLSGRHLPPPIPTPGCRSSHGESDLKEQLPLCQPRSAAGRKQGGRPPYPHPGATEPFGMPD